MPCCPGRPTIAGQRLTGVTLVQDHDGSAQDDWLVRYSFSAAGDLLAVRHRHGEVVREFEWQDHMLIAHRVPGGMEARYTWDRHAPDGRVVGQQEVAALPDATPITSITPRSPTAWAVKSCIYFMGSRPRPALDCPHPC